MHRIWANKNRLHHSKTINHGDSSQTLWRSLLFSPLKNRVTFSLTIPKTRLQICPLYILGNKATDGTYGSKYWFPGFGFDSGPNLQPCKKVTNSQNCQWEPIFFAKQKVIPPSSVRLLRNFVSSQNGPPNRFVCFLFLPIC